jgi:UDP-glucose 4-epimerase
MLSQALRRLKRPTVPMPGFAVGAVGSVLRSARLADFSPEQLSFLTYGRGVDTSRMREQLGFEPAFTTEEAFADFAAGLTPTGGRIEKVLTTALDHLPPVEPPALARSGGEDRG